MSRAHFNDSGQKNWNEAAWVVVFDHTGLRHTAPTRAYNLPFLELFERVVFLAQSAARL